MDLASVSSIGGGAVAFFPPTHYYQHIPPRGRGTDAQLTAQELLSRCESTARRIRERGDNIYGALDEGDSRKGALFCRSGTWLEIMDDYTASIKPIRGDRIETVRGTPMKNSKYGLLEFVSVAIGLVSIRGLEVNRYLCMNRDGHLYSTPFSNFSAECVFLEEMMENYYNVYSSCMFGTRRRPWYIALRRTGRPRVGKKTRKRRKASHFLVVHYDDAPTVGPEDVSLAELLVPSLKHQPPNNVIFRIKEPPKRPPSKIYTPPPFFADMQKKNKKKRRRQQRLQTEEAIRKRRKDELDALRARELEARDNRILPRLSGAGYEIRPRRMYQPT